MCAAADACHVAGTCDPSTGLCSTPAAPADTPCDDGDACTTRDACAAGVCVGASPVVCPAAGPCHESARCDPATGACVAPPLGDDTPCDDADACTRTDRCQAGTCVGGEPVTCPAADTCHVAGACDPATGTCSTPAAPDATPCDDGDACTRQDGCVAGVCEGADRVTCPAADACHVAGTCDPATGTCATPAVADDTPCNDADACTRADRCRAGTCTGTDPVVCTALDQCHQTGSCDPQTGRCSTPPQPEFSECSDGIPCTAADTCRAGVCTGIPLPGCCTDDDGCDDGIACTDDRCTAAATCVHVPVDDRCGDGGECARAVCAPGDVAAAPDGCTQRPVSEAAFCAEDADPCTADQCRSGSCAHERGQSADDCADLLAPLASASALRGRTDGLRATVNAAVTVGCSAVTQETGCDVVSGDDGPGEMLLDLLAQVRADLEAAMQALGGRLGDAQTAEMRARLALTLLADTPQELRTFRGVLGMGRSHRRVSPAFARAQRAEGRSLLAAVGKLRLQLRRLTARRQAFTR